MKLRDLEAHFSKYTVTDVDPTTFVRGVLHPDGKERTYRWVETLAEADGIWFKCPKCFPTRMERTTSNCPEGYTHWIMIGFRDRCPPNCYTVGSSGEDTRWQVEPSSTGMDDLVLTPSIQHGGECRWHGFVGSSGVPPGEAA